MSSLSSASTLAEIAAAYVDNASYSEDSSAAKARAFVTACRILLLKRPTEVSVDRRSINFDMKLIQQEMVAAKEWLDTHSTSDTDSGPRVTGADFRDFR
jgi:hypothetical protein